MSEKAITKWQSILSVKKCTYRVSTKSWGGILINPYTGFLLRNYAGWGFKGFFSNEIYLVDLIVTL